MAVLAVMNRMKSLRLVDRIVATEKGLIFGKDWTCPLSMKTFFSIFFFFSKINLTYLFFLINFDFIDKLFFFFDLHKLYIKFLYFSL